MKRRSYKGSENPAYVHGLHKSPTWFSWTFMKQRCLNVNRPDYKYYGGRGITFDPKWNKFEHFIEEMGIRPPGLTLDRIDVNKPYSKGNCRWISRVRQTLNRRPYVCKIKRDINGRFTSCK